MSMHREEDFQALARLAMEQAVAYRNTRHPPRPTASLDTLQARFQVPLPDVGRPGEEVLAGLVAAAEGGLAGTTQPDFYAWVMGASHPVGVAAEWLVTSWGQNAGTYDTAPAAATAEDAVSRWLLELLDLPRESSVGFSTGATMASTICLAAARSEVLLRAGYNLEQEGVFRAPPVAVFLGEEAHTTIRSGLRYLGFGERDLRQVPVDEQGRMRPDALRTALESWQGPAIVICQAGHMMSGDFDPVGELADLANSRGAWCHVDGAFGLWARTVPELKSLCPGVERADSWAVDGHKWLQVPYDSGYAIVRHGEAHRRAMDTSASYLGEAPWGARTPSQYCPELSRRARGFAAWAVIQSLGRQGIREMVQRHCNCARQLAQRLQADPRVQVLNRVVLNQLALSFGPDQPGHERDRLTEAVAAQLAQENRVFLETARWRGRRVLRVSIIARETGPADIEFLAGEILGALEAVSPRESPPGQARPGTVPAGPGAPDRKVFPGQKRG